MGSSWWSHNNTLVFSNWCIKLLMSWCGSETYPNEQLPRNRLASLGVLSLPVFLLVLACNMGSGFHNNMKEMLQTLGFYIFKRMIILMKKEKVRCFQRSTCQMYSRLFWGQNLEIDSKSKNIHVKIVSKGHTYVSLCCIANLCSLQFEFFHEPALPRDSESLMGSDSLCVLKLSQLFRFLLYVVFQICLWNSAFNRVLRQ